MIFGKTKAKRAMTQGNSPSPDSALDELHTYRGRQGTDVALLVRRVRERLQPENLLCIGTSATMASEGSLEELSILLRMKQEVCGSSSMTRMRTGPNIIRVERLGWVVGRFGRRFSRRRPSTFVHDGVERSVSASQTRYRHAR